MKRARQKDGKQTYSAHDHGGEESGHKEERNGRFAVSVAVVQVVHIGSLRKEHQKRQEEGKEAGKGVIGSDGQRWRAARRTWSQSANMTTR